MRTILKLNDLYDISEFLNEKKFNEAPITIVIDVMTKERLKRINEEFFSESGRPENELQDDVDQICVNVLGVKFIYRLKEDGNENTEQGAN